MILRMVPQRAICLAVVSVGFFDPNSYLQEKWWVKSPFPSIHCKLVGFRVPGAFISLPTGSPKTYLKSWESKETLRQCPPRNKILVKDY